MRKEGMMDKAEAAEPKSGHDRPAKAAGVGNERKANMRGAIDGNPTDGSPLKHAMHELHEQHPHEHHDHGPHHGTKEHIRHMPLHGMKPTGRM